MSPNPADQERVMHRALGIHEMVDHMLAQYDCHEDEDQATLGRLACTCSGFAAIAVKYLWAEMWDVVPFFRLLGPMEFEDIPSQYEDEIPFYRQWRFTESAISEEGWSRFDRYAALVRRIRFEPLSVTCVHGVYNLIFKYRPMTADFFPNLQKLFIQNYADENVSLESVVMLLSSNLRELETWIDTENHAEVFYTRYVPSILHNIEELHISPFLIPDEIEAYVRNLPTLKKLGVEVVAVSRTLFRTLGRLPKLEILRIPGTPGKERLANFPSRSFATLKSLHIGATVSAWAALLEAGHVPPGLTTVEISAGIQQGSDPHEVGRLIRAVAKEVPKLENFQMDVEWEVADRHTIQFQDLSPLLSCRALRSLIVHNPSGVHITPNDVRTILTSWLDLRCLRFHSYKVLRRLDGGGDSEGTIHPRDLSLEILDLFAELCPGIEELALPIKATQPQAQFPDALGPLRHLKTLEVYDIALAYPESVAIYLTQRTTRSMSLHWQEFPLTPDSSEYAAVSDAWEETFNRWLAVEVALNALFTLRTVMVPRSRPGWQATGERSSRNLYAYITAGTVE